MSATPLRVLLLALPLLAWMAPASAHRASDAFVSVAMRDGQLSGSWEIALRDLEAAITLDGDRNREITWGELKAAQPRLDQQLAPLLEIEAGGARCMLRIADLMVNDRADGPYAWLVLSGHCPAAGSLVVRYRLLFDIDPTHRAILSLSGADGVVQTAVLAPEADRYPHAGAAAGPWAQFSSYLREGITHIWAGYDHILFLLSLLLPCVLVWQGGRWHGVAPGRDAAREVARQVVWVVTAFTLAHSVTLSLAALDLVRLPARLVEPVIALTVLLAALNNVWPLVTRYRASVALGFGLIHGFGFATALGELGLPPGARLLGLLGFNLGVEAGQLLIVVIVVPALYALRATRFYLRAVLQGGSMVVAALAANWLIERITGG